MIKNMPANARDMRHRFHPWVAKVPWKRARQPTPVFLPGEFHGQIMKRRGALRFYYSRTNTPGLMTVNLTPEGKSKI